MLLTRFERARILGARALQIALGAPPLVAPANEPDPLRLAFAELDAGVLPLQVRRTRLGRR
jgi:DNA-directed RNA polymerase subunit K